MRLECPPLATRMIETSLILYKWNMEQELYNLIAAECFYDGEIKPSLTMEELGIDSLEYINLLLRVEGAFGIRIPDARKVAMETVSDLLATVQELA